MKKKEVKTLEKKLQLSRETLRELESSESQNVLGGAIICSPPTHENDPCPAA
jgi:hypothetical protein